jgi:hypothetical protein
MKTQTMSLVIALLLCSNSVLGAKLLNQVEVAKAPTKLNTLAQLKSKATQEEDEYLEYDDEAEDYDYGDEREL